jgi:putative aldouronate transport system substrate-binding protein
MTADDIYSPESYERRLQQATKLYEGHEHDQVYPIWSIWIEPAVADEVATLRTNIESYITNNTLQFITGSKRLDVDWEAYVAGLDQLGLPRYLEIMQQAYDKPVQQ